MRVESDRQRLVPWLNYFDGWFIAVTSCVFALLIITQSSYQGRLSFPPTFDDIAYFKDALSRLQVFYDHGVIRCFKDLYLIPPHAPLSTVIAFIGFALFGIKEWAPAAVNVIWVALILVFIKFLLRDVPRWAYAAVSLSALCWPLTADIVVDCRPDIFTSLLTVMGCTLIIRTSFLRAGLQHGILIGGLFGAALLAKPSIFPVTIILYGASLCVKILIEHRHIRDPKFFRTGAKRVLECSAVTGIIILPYFVSAWRQVYGYIYMVLVGQNDVWGIHMNAYDSATFYLWGPGGHAMMGAWLWVALCLVGVSAILHLLEWRRPNDKAIGLFAIFILAYAIVSLPPVKQPYLGVIVSAFLLTFYVLAARQILHTLGRFGKHGQWLRVPFVVGLLFTSIFLFDWTSWAYMMPARSHLETTRFWQINERIADYIEEHAKEYTKELIVFPVIGNFENGHTLEFELYKRHLKNFETVSHIFMLPNIPDILRRADYIVLLDEDDPDIIRWLPNVDQYAAFKNEIITDPLFEKALKIPAGDGVHEIDLYKRIEPIDAYPFGDLVAISGFLPVEGPNPQPNLSYDRWATGRSARGKFGTTKAGSGRLAMRASTYLSGQSIRVSLDGVYVGTCTLERINSWTDCSFPVQVAHPNPLVDLQFTRSGTRADGERSVLFAMLRLFSKR